MLKRKPSILTKVHDRNQWVLFKKFDETLSSKKIEISVQIINKG
jgi:hypothetical protein